MFLSPLPVARLLAWAAVLLAGGVAQQPGATSPNSTLPLQLTGLMVDTDAPARSACLIRCTRPPERHVMLVAGERACDVAEVLEVRDVGVVLKNLETGRMELLTSSAATSSHAVPHALRQGASPAARADEAEPVLPEVSVRRYLANLPELLASAVARPRYQDGANGQRVVDGFEIGQVTAGGAADKLGLRNGDVIQQVNGQSLDGMATVMRLFEQLPALAQVKVTVLRNGQKLTFVLNTK
jgi:type II secretory pathway component PulC